MKIEKIVVFANISRPLVSEAVKVVTEFLVKDYSVDVCTLSSDSNDSLIKAPKCDLAISVGGDGTVLTCAGLLAPDKTPIIAVNLGTFGYIADTELEEFETVFNEYVEGKLNIVERIMLEERIIRNNRVVYKSCALNDVTVSSSSRSKVARLSLYLNNIHAAQLKCDGLIVSTPTGSTAYNLSAGGPILESSLESIIVNPICPFTMGFRPLVVSDSSVIKVEIPDQNSSICACCDGHVAFDLQSGDTVEISKSSLKARFVENGKRSSIELIRDKLGWAGGFNA